MAEYIQSSLTTTENVSLGNAITFDSSIPCNRGYVLHENGTGIFILRGAVNNSNCCFARYQITFNGNIGIPEDGEVTPIAVGIAVNGEVRPFSKAIFVPTETLPDDIGNVTSTAIVTVPKGCCFTVSVDYVDATTEDPATTPTPAIAVRNGNLVISRIA